MSRATQRAQRIGIFGGSFDPVHNAHLALARAALGGLRLDSLLWVPAGRPWQKVRQLTEAAHREAMLRLAIAEEPRFVLSRIEIERGGATYTVDTVRELQAGNSQFRSSQAGSLQAGSAQAGSLQAGNSQAGSSQAVDPQAEWFLVIGQDQFAGFHTWQGWEELLSRVTLAIANRPDAAPAADPRVLEAAAHRHVTLPMMDISSSDIRARLAAGLSVADLVPAPVARYIARHHLYRDPNLAQELNGHS